MGEFVRKWIDPRYVDLVNHYDGTQVGDTNVAKETKDCGNCSGMGRIIYIDPKSKKPKDIVCPGCGGRGQVPA